MRHILIALFIVACTSNAFADELSSGDTAWIMLSSALVLLMLPGLALFYSGMVRAKKNTLSTFLYSFSAFVWSG